VTDGSSRSWIYRYQSPTRSFDKIRSSVLSAEGKTVEALGERKCAETRSPAGGDSAPSRLLRSFPGVARFNGKPRSGDVVSGTWSWRGSGSGNEESTNYASGPCWRAWCWRGGERGDRSLGSRRVARAARGREHRARGTRGHRPWEWNIVAFLSPRRIEPLSRARARARVPRPAFLTSKERGERIS
jgi:hypothetical protein